MLKRPYPSWLNRYLGLGIPLIGVVIVGGIFFERQRQQVETVTPATPDSASAVTPSTRPFPASPAPTPSAIASTSVPLAGIVPHLSPRPGQPSATPSASPAASATPPLTPAQQAANQQAIEEFHASMPTIDTSIEMHVAIAVGVPSTTFSSAGGANLRDRNGQSLRSLAAGENYTIQAQGNAIALGSWDLPSVVWIEIPPTSTFRLGDREYRGQLLLAAESGRLWAVNYVNMRQYLYSVVGSEVSPSWDMEALKAQAVAARSYALTYYFRPANDLYHLGATERYQVYRGIEREADRTNQAVDETAGEFVSYRGGIVESLYAASDDIVAEAFQGRGMSQLGALNLAEQGYSYQQILSNYYPGTGVGRVEQDYE